MGLLHLFQERFGFTRNELVAVVILSIVFLVGSVVKIWVPPPASRSGHPAFSYAALDSEFLALSMPAGDSASTPHRSAVVKASARPAPGSININEASAAEFESLPGIGPALAGRIIAYRAVHGHFGTVDALADVRGIGSRTLERLRPYIRTGGPPVP